MFSKLIEKPKMQEKFLRKPPPRYVFDMIINTMEKTGFPKGLYSDEEMQVKHFEESPQNKVEFFQKTIDITKIVLNDKFEIKTTNILKGEEPDKTNYFLQAFYRAATSGKDSSKYIQRYLDHKKKKAEEKKKDSDEPQKAPEKAKEPREKESAPKPSEAPKEKEKGKEKPTAPPSNCVSTTEAKKTVTAQRPMSSLKKPEKIASEIKEVDDEKNVNAKAPQGLIKDSKKNESNEKNKNDNNNDDDLSAPKNSGSKIKISQKIGFFKDIQDAENTKTTSLNITDIEAIKNYVQEISKNSNPIGKLLDFLGDDIESMNKELQSWIKESKNYKERLDEEVKKTDEVILPLQNELMELEDNIRDEHMRIRSIKSRLIKNEQIIHNLINNVISIKSDK